MLTTGDKQLEIGGMPYGGGYGGFSGGGLGFGLILGLLFGRGFGHGSTFGGGSCCGTSLGAFSKLESIQDQITNQSITEQFNATNVNINNGFRDQAIGFAGISRDICELGARSDLQFANVNKNICDSTTTILTAIKDGEIQALRDKLASQTLDNEFNKRGLFEGSGPVIQAHSPATARDHDNIALLLANQHAMNLALNTGTNVNTGFQGQGLGQGIGQGALQK